MKAVTITLDGVEVSGREGMTILELAQEVGVEIPTLCYDRHLGAYGACRVCMVEEERSGRLLAACVTPITPGMVINTRSERVLEARRTVVELMLASHPEACVVCDEGNRCELRRIAAELGLGITQMYRLRRFLPIQELNPILQRDLSKCILCGKCIRACQEWEVMGVLEYAHRGFEAIPTTMDYVPLEASGCTFCGTCATVCPTGALSEPWPLYRATPQARVSSVCGWCGCGCALELHLQEGKLIAVSPRSDGWNRISLCSRGHYGHDHLLRGRLEHPLIREADGLREASWEEALELVARGLEEVRDRHGPGALGVIGSAKCTNEEAYLLQRLARGALGTTHLDSGARLWGAALEALRQATGQGASTATFQDLEEAEAVILWGCDPGESHPVLGSALRRAARRGLKLALVDPLKGSLEGFARYHLRPRPGAEAWAVWALLEALEGRREEAAERAGLSAAEVEEVVRLLEGRCVLIVGEETCRDWQLAAGLVDIALRSGNLWGKGRGVMVLLGDCNAQGALDMGLDPWLLPGQLPLKEATHLERAWRRGLSREPGWSLGEMITAAQRGELRGLYVVGANPLRSLPDASLVREALEKLDFLVVQDLYLTETAQLAQVVLPAAAFAEKGGTFTNLEGRLQALRPAATPPGEARPDGQILIELSEMLSLPLREEVQEEMAKLVPLYGRTLAEGGRWPRPKGAPEDIFLEPPSGTPPEGETVLGFRALLHHLGSGTRSLRSERLQALAGPLGVASPPGREGRATLWLPRGAREVELRPTPRVPPGMLVAPHCLVELRGMLELRLDPVSRAPRLEATVKLEEG